MIKEIESKWARQREQMMARRMLAARTTSGRAFFECSVWWKRLCWRSKLALPALAKRGFDLVASAVLIGLFLPLLALITICIKLEDGGPVFFIQTRVGKWGRHFKMYKFRSMCLDAEKQMEELLAKNQHTTGITFKIKDDPRVTRVGNILRKTSFDELPQLFNVLLGNMSLVGPRPPVPREVALYTVADRRRLHITPGITCFWQIGGRAELDFPQQVQLDVSYIEKQNLFTDMVILLKTIPAVIRRKGAY